MMTIKSLHFSIPNTLKTAPSSNRFTTTIPHTNNNNNKPSKSIASPRCCLTPESLVSHPQQSFSSQIYHTQPTPQQQSQTINTLIFFYDAQEYNSPYVQKCIKHRRFYMLEHDNYDGFDSEGILVNPRIVSLDLPHERREISSLVGSANGLVCLAEDEKENDPIHICNPVTGEYVKLPSVPNNNYQITSGFVFDQGTSEYKVVRIYDDWNGYYVTEIYTLGSGQWRRVGVAPYPIDPFYSPQVFVNRALHWLSYEECSILCFDLCTEKFQVLPLPHCFPLGSNTRLAFFLNDLGGNLCLVDTSDITRIEIWVMKQHGVKSSWTKEFVISTRLRGEYRSVFPVRLMKNGNILLHVRKVDDDVDEEVEDDLECCGEVDHLECYDPAKKTFRKLGIDKFPCKSWSFIVPHARSYVSLKDIVGRTDGNLKRMDS